MHQSCARVLPPFVAFLVLILFACDDQGTDPGDPVIHTTIDRLWPNADGNSWTFDYKIH